MRRAYLFKEVRFSAAPYPWSNAATSATATPLHQLMTVNRTLRMYALRLMLPLLVFTLTHYIS
eukprot:28586-Eustigmatos_ZCMA.PRE.1